MTAPKHLEMKGSIIPLQENEKSNLSTKHHTTLHC